MIAITDTSVFSGLDLVQPTQILPTVAQINSMIGSSDFINTTITNSVKNILIRIRNEVNIININSSNIFGVAGFNMDPAGNLYFSPNNLDTFTYFVLNRLNLYSNPTTSYINSFSGTSILKDANDIRAMANSGLKKINHISVTVNDILINTRSENTDRFLRIIPEQTAGALGNRVDQNGDLIPGPLLPHYIVVHNNTTEAIRLRVKIEYTKTANANGTGTTYRKFLDYFPEESNPFNINTDTRIVQPNGSVDNSGNPTDRIFIDELIDKVRGGKAIIQFVVGNDTWIDNNIHIFNFYIRAENPTRDQVVNYLQQPRGANGTDPSYLNRYWFLIKLIRHESGTNNSNEFRQFNTQGAGYLYNNNRIGLPNFGAPRGFGLGQIDNTGQLTTAEITNLGLTTELAEIQPGGTREYQTIIDNTGRTIDNTRRLVASDNEVWNWKKNIDRIVTILESKKQTIINKYTGTNGYITIANQWNNNNANNLVALLPQRTEGNISFDEVNSQLENIPALINNYFSGASTNVLKSFFDANLIKYYNGGYYHTLERPNPVNGVLQKPYWSITDTNNLGFNYVHRICDLND